MIFHSTLFRKMHKYIDKLVLDYGNIRNGLECQSKLRKKDIRKLANQAKFIAKRLSGLVESHPRGK